MCMHLFEQMLIVLSWIVLRVLVGNLQWSAFNEVAINEVAIICEQKSKYEDHSRTRSVQSDSMLLVAA